MVLRVLATPQNPILYSLSNSSSSMLIATTQQIRNIDLRTIKDFGITGLQLMERAGQGLLQAALRILGERRTGRAAIFCGKGNNGGDGYVLARLLSENGARPECFLLAKESEIKGDAATNLSWLRTLKIPVHIIEKRQQIPNLGDYALVVDAIFGFGFSGEVKGIARDMINAINAFNGPVLAVDTPSGADMDTGLVGDSCVRATETVTFGLVKVGQMFHPCRQYLGKLVLHDLGFPPQAVEKENISTGLVDANWTARHLPPRRPDANKIDFGRVLVVAGSRGMTGAALLAAKAVLRAGAGMVAIAAPVSVFPVLASNFMETMVIALPETKAGSLSSEAFDALMERTETWADVLLVGPGMGRHRETASLIRKFVSKAPKPAVLDADGLNAFQEDSADLCKLPWPRILTPHWGELNRLWPVEQEPHGNRRIEWLTDLARNVVRNTMILKGAPTLIAGQTGICQICAAGNSGMATAGTGDVLSGIIAGLLAQGVEALPAAAAGVYLHGRAGDLAARDLSEYALIAGDLLSYLPKALQECAQIAAPRLA